MERYTPLNVLAEEEEEKMEEEGGGDAAAAVDAAKRPTSLQCPQNDVSIF